MRKFLTAIVLAFFLMVATPASAGVVVPPITLPPVTLPAITVTVPGPIVTVTGPIVTAPGQTVTVTQAGGGVRTVTQTVTAPGNSQPARTVTVPTPQSTDDIAPVPTPTGQTVTSTATMVGPTQTVTKAGDERVVRTTVTQAATISAGLVLLGAVVLLLGLAAMYRLGMSEGDSRTARFLRRLTDQARQR